MPTEFDSDSMLAFMTELTKKVADLKKEMVGVGDQAGTGIHKTSDETERFGKTVERHTKNIEGMKRETAGLVGLLRGPLGIAAALYGAGQAVANFAQGQLQLRNFATDVGLTAAAIQKMRVQLSAAGIDSKTADQQISALSSKLDSIKTLTTASPVYKSIAANDPLLAKQLLDAERLGNRVESIRLIVEKLRTGGERSKLYLGQELGINQSTAAALAKDTRGLVMPKIYDPKELEEYNKNWHNVTQTIENVWGDLMMRMTSEGNKFFNEARREFGNLKKLKKDFEGEGKPGEQLFGPKGFLPNKKELEDAWNALKKQMSGSAHAAAPTGKEALLEGDASFADRFGAWGDEDEGALPKNARPRSFSPEIVQRDELDVQKNSNQLLQDIRDLISGDKQGVWGGGSGAGGRGGVPGGGPAAGSPAATSGSTPGTPSRGSTGADGRVPETSSDAAYGGGGGGSHGGLDRAAYDGMFKGTPLEGKYDAVVKAAKENNVPPSVMAGIIAHETGKGTSKMLRERNNPAGLMDPKTGMRQGQTFTSVEEGIAAAGRSIGKRYNEAGGDLDRMGRVYAPPGAANDPYGTNRAWPRDVARYRERLKTRTAFGADGVTADEAQRAELARRSMDKSLVASRDLGGAKIRIDFTDTPEKLKGDPGILATGPFQNLKIRRAPQAPSTGGGAADFTRFAFE